MPHYVADIGNSRLKIARIDDFGNLRDHRAHALDVPSEWEALDAWVASIPEDARWSIASVNPPATDRFQVRLAPRSVRLVNSAADVPIPNHLERPESTGADRALAVLAGRRLGRPGEWGLIVSCGTAITIERVLEDGTWDGGVIAPGLMLAARSLGRSTAQLPHVDLSHDAPCWGRSTVPAIQAGVFWGTVGALRELIARQREARPEPWLLWTGGDAELLARHVENGPPLICPDLVLQGLGLLAAHGDSSP